jgi:hypothetical protein
MTTWTPEVRIEVARKIASAMLTEARGIIMSHRVAELSELILYVLSMPPSVLDANHAKYSEWL